MTYTHFAKMSKVIWDSSEKAWNILRDVNWCGVGETFTHFCCWNDFIYTNGYEFFCFLALYLLFFHFLFSLVLWMLWCGFTNMTGNSLIHAQDLNGMKRYHNNFHQKLFRMCHMLSMNMLCFSSSSLKFVILSQQYKQHKNIMPKRNISKMWHKRIEIF